MKSPHFAHRWVRFTLTALLSVTAITSTAQAQTAEPKCSAGQRLFEHLYGKACIPEKASRVVSLDFAITELLYINGQKPAAYSSLITTSYERMHPELKDQFAALNADLPDMGFPPNLEVIVKAQPDLIIAPDDLISESIYPQLAQVAPTVVYKASAGDWRSRLKFAGDALGLAENVDTLLTNFDARVTELKTELNQALGADAGKFKLSLVRTFPGQIGLLLPGTAGDALVSEVGLSRPEGQIRDRNFVLNENNGRPELLIGRESLTLADGDAIFVFGDASELENDALWKALTAVKAGRAYTVGYYWWGDTLLSAHDMLDDLFEYVAGKPSVLPNPFETGFVGSVDTESTIEPTTQATKQN